MAKDKRSFFERLTGTVNMNGDFDDSLEEAVEKIESGESLSSALEEAGEGRLPVDVYQTPSEIIIKTMVAGIRPQEDLEISISRDMVVIKGKRTEEKKVTDEDFFHRELYWGSFSRTILLPQEIEPDEAEAIEDHGLLILRLPKIDKARQRKIKVKTR